jgi:hypothetical protein
VAGDAFVHRTALAALRGLAAGGQIAQVRHLAGAPAAAAATTSFLDGFTVAMWIATGAVAVALVAVVVVLLNRTSVHRGQPLPPLVPARTRADDGVDPDSGEGGRNR